MSNPQFDEECRKAAGESSADDKDKRIEELETNGILAFLEIRKAIGDPEGRLSQPEVVEKVKDAMRGKRRLWNALHSMIELVNRCGIDDAPRDFSETINFAEEALREESK